MFRNKVTCTSCSERIDALDVDCPYCHTHNVEYDKMHLSPNALNVKWYFQLALFLGGWLGLEIIGTIVQILTAAIKGISIQDLVNDIHLLAVDEFVIYFILFLGLGLLIFFSSGYKQLGRPLKSWKTYVFGLAGYIAMIQASFIWSSFQSIFNNSTSNNQTLVIQIVLAYPILSIIFLCIIGPICEELTYRVGLFGLLRRWNRVAAYLLSTFIFGFIHFDISSVISFLQGNATPFINELWNFPSYLIAGASLAFIYDFFGFGASSLAHILNNLISILLIILQHYVGQQAGS